VKAIEPSHDMEMNRTIGLFLFDSESQHKTQINSIHNTTRSTSTIHSPSSGADAGTGTGTDANKVRNNKNKGMINNHHHHKGLPPRAPFATSATTTVSSNSSPLYNNWTQPQDDIISSCHSSQSGGPLWQLAKLQAMSEGPIPSLKTSSSSQSSSKSNSSNKSKQTKNKKSSSSSSSQSSSSSSSYPGGKSIKSSSTDPEEIQMKHAERNLKAMHSLAQQHLKFGEIYEAIEVLEEMLRGVKELHGDDHYRVGTVLHNIATVHIQSRNFRKATFICRKAIEIRKVALGHLHPDLAASIAQLGIAHLELEEHQGAIHAFQRALVIRRKTLSYNDPKIARLLNNIGCSLFEVGKLEEAEKSFDEALSIQKSLLDESGVSGTSTSTSSSMERNYGQHLSSSSDLARLSQFRNKNVRDALLGVAATLCNIGSLNLRWKKYDEAIAALEEALLLQKSVYTDDHPTVRTTKDSIALVNSSRPKKTHKMYNNIADLTESLHNDLGVDQSMHTSCEAPLRTFISNVMKLKETGWKETFEDFKLSDWKEVAGDLLFGNDKLCSSDTTVPSYYYPFEKKEDKNPFEKKQDNTNLADNTSLADNSASGGSHDHDFHLI